MVWLFESVITADIPLIQREASIPVKICIESFPKVVRNGIDHDVKYDGRQNAVALDNWEVWLPLATEPHCALGVVAAYSLAQHRVLDYNAQRKQRQLPVLADTR